MPCHKVRHQAIEAGAGAARVQVVLSRSEAEAFERGTFDGPPDPRTEPVGVFPSFYVPILGGERPEIA